MIDWNKYFDHIYVLSRCSNFAQRDIIKQEFDRVNLVDWEFWYNSDNELINYDHFTNHILTSQKRCTFGHYSILKTCYELGYDNVLIFEDDTRFLRDINEIQHQLDIFQQCKNDIDIYCFDYNIDNGVIFMATCWYYNKKGMEYMIYMCENNVLQIDNYLYTDFLNNSNITNKDIIFYINEHN